MMTRLYRIDIIAWTSKRTHKSSVVPQPRTNLNTPMPFPWINLLQSFKMPLKFYTLYAKINNICTTGTENKCDCAFNVIHMTLKTASQFSD